MRVGLYANRLVRVGFSRLGARQRLEAWISLVALSAHGPGDWVARVIGRALRTRVPRARYLVGYDAQALAVADRLTPTIVKDVAIRFGFGLG